MQTLSPYASDNTSYIALLTEPCAFPSLADSVSHANRRACLPAQHRLNPHLALPYRPADGERCWYATAAGVQLRALQRARVQPGHWVHRLVVARAKHICNKSRRCRAPRFATYDRGRFGRSFGYGIWIAGCHRGRASVYFADVLIFEPSYCLLRVDCLVLLDVHSCIILVARALLCYLHIQRAKACLEPNLQGSRKEYVGNNYTPSSLLQ